MKVVLFGAGASVGSGEVNPKAPPLGKDLFDDLVMLFPSVWGNIPEYLRAEFRQDFERGMGMLIDKYGFSTTQLMQCMAIFFSNFGLATSDNNLYFRFFDFLISKNLLKEILVSTLNYECLLEIAANLNGLQIGYFKDPGSGNHIAPIWKLHGSCNFKPTGFYATRGIYYSGKGVAFDGGLKFLNPYDVRKLYRGNTALYPAMCLYAKGKPIAMAPSIIRKAQTSWADFVIRADVICVIGVQPNPDDSHIWSPIAESNAKLCYLGNEATFEVWASQYRVDKVNLYLGNRWISGFDEINNHLC